MIDDMTKSLNYLKILSMDIINKARNGHPGIALSAAPIIFSLFTRHLKVNPSDPNWLNRDRFVMSAGHGSALLYATLYMAGYAINVDDLASFRQINSKTPGHPEYGVTPGVEMTTGALGQGLATAVGMALAERYIGTVIDASLKKQQIINHYTYVLAGDGDLMEGVGYEAASFAGVHNLGKLIVLYDSNNMTLDASTKNTFRDDIRARFEALGWHYELVREGTDVKEIDKAIGKAKKITNKPSLIEIKTILGHGTYNEGKNIVHGKPLSNDDLDTLRRKLGIKTQPFEVDEKAINYFKNSINERVLKNYEDWQKYYKKYQAIVDADIQKNVAFLERKDIIANFDSRNFKIQSNYYEELRESNSKIMNLISDRTSFYLGGSADLSSSCRTNLYKELEMSTKNPQGKNISFGVREHAMGAIINGMALSGLNVYGSTFLSFADYLKPAIRQAALMNIPSTFIFTHDSISIGQDGPTHQPIEQLTMLRTIPNLTVYRPADIREVIGVWDLILKNKKPSALIISKDPTKILINSDSEKTKFGAYTVSSETGQLSAVILATGVEVGMACEIKDDANLTTVRVVSMPSMEIFLDQSLEYQESIIPAGVPVITLEYGNTLIWNRFATSEKYTIGINSFGASGKSDDVKMKFQLDYESVKSKIISLLSSGE